MKTLALGFGLLTLVLLNLAATTQQQKSPDDAAVRAIVTNYIESYYAGDAMRLEKVLASSLPQTHDQQVAWPAQNDGMDRIADASGSSIRAI